MALWRLLGGDVADWQRFEVKEGDAGDRLDRFLAAATGDSRGQVRRAITAGAVRVDGRRQRLQAHPVAPGTVIEIAAAPAAVATGVELEILHEDEDLLVVCKPAGLPSVKPPQGGPSLLDLVCTHLRHQGLRSVGEVHRLDRDASGLMVFGRHREAVAALGTALADRRVSRGYLAWVRCIQSPVAQRIDAPLRSLSGGGVEVHPTGQLAATRLTPLAFDGVNRVALCGLSLESGRTHQVRAHLSWAVGPIIGDLRYGDPRADALGRSGWDRIALHAARLALRHPRTRQGMSWIAPPDASLLGDATFGLAPPEDWVAKLRDLGRYGVVEDPGSVAVDDEVPVDDDAAIT